MEQIAHWSQTTTANVVYEISSTFVAQLETKMEKEQISRSELAKRLNKTTGRVSQVLNDPGNLGLNLIVEYARELGMKVSIVAYEDGDPKNENGPINPEVFVRCWEKQGCPANLFEVNEVKAMHSPTSAIVAAVPVTGAPYYIGIVYGAGQTNPPNPVTAGVLPKASSDWIIPGFPSIDDDWLGQPIPTTPQVGKEKVRDAA
jgi:transcriptional regulator with XRE-family HTH domain